MIGVDTSSFVAYLQGEDAEAVDLVRQAIKDETLVMPPFVVTELFSAPNLRGEIKAMILELPQMPINPDFWERAGEARATVLRARKKARTMDTMIAAHCIDHDMPLIARGGDYRHFVEHFALELKSER